MNTLNSFNIQINHIQASSLLDVNSIHTYESINHRLATIGSHWITKRIGYNLDLHSRFDANTIGIVGTLSSNNESRHILHSPINPQNQLCLKLTKREGVRISSLFIETKASPNAHPKNESNKYSPRLYRNIRIQHGHPLNVYDKVSVFVYFLIGI